jgi:hypothetical protein
MEMIGFHSTKQIWRLAIRILLISILAIMPTACGDGDGDDDSDDDDDNDDDDAYAWPDNTGPVVGWVAISMLSGDMWDALYEIREEDYVEVTPPGNVPFLAGSLASRDVGWALNKKTELNELYRLDSGVWTLMDSQPPCSWTESDIYSTIRGVQVFPDEKGYVLCGGGHLMAWDGDVWTKHDLPNAEDSDGYRSGIDCLSWDDCVAWNYDNLYFWDGSEFIAEDKKKTMKAIMQNSELAYRIYVHDSDEILYSVEVRRDGVWVDEDIHFPGNIDGNLSMSRIDKHNTAFSYSHKSEEFNVVLNENGIEASQSWSTLSHSDFAQNYGGLGVSPEDRTVYRIHGTETEEIFSHGYSFGHLLVLAADAE